MKALLLAAGFGKRLGEVTQNTPKCLVKVGHQTMLDHWLYKLEKLGVQQFFINTHYLAHQVEEFIASHPLKNKINVLHERNLLGTGRTILFNADSLQDDVCFILHADNYCFDPLDRFLCAHNQRPNDTILSMLTFTTKAPTKCGIVEVDAYDKLIAFHEKIQSPPSDRANGAVYIASKEFFETLKGSGSDLIDFSCDVIPSFIGKIFCYHTDLYFEDIGTIETLKRANEFTGRRTNQNSQIYANSQCFEPES